jgi:quercetin dioxygenase-like cupin family protein
MFFPDAAALAQFNSEKMAKSNLVNGEFLFAGLNSFEPGQEHALHAHEGQDKLYVILLGDAVVQVGEETRRLAAGGVAFAPSGIPHAIRNEGPRRLVVMAILGPPPRK